MKLGQMKLAFSIRASLIGLGAIASSASLAQSGWCCQTPLPQGTTLRAVCFVDATTGTAVGDYGTILRTTDGGATWTLQTSGTTSIGLSGVSFVDANTGTAVGAPYPVGSFATILRTTDGGATWTPQMSGAAGCRGAESFVDANTGTAGGEHRDGPPEARADATWRAR